MDKLKKSRGIARAIFTKNCNSLETLLTEEDAVVKIQAQFEILESKHEELLQMDKQVYDNLLEANASEEDIVNDIEKADEYTSLFKEIKIRVSKLVNTSANANDLESIACISEHMSNVNSVIQQDMRRPRRFKLPIIELKRFDGNLINWLQFWAQFSKIHNDEFIAKEDKFQYLLQSIEPNTRAYDLVTSFPPTASNYEKVIEGLKNRFGKDDLLVEVYVRELLKLVLQNVMDKQFKLPLQSLYDKLESHLRAIDSLGVTTDKCAAMLFPLVESCMPEDLLRAWQRSSLHVGGGETMSRLDNLMKFMLSEVEGEQRIGLAMSSFGLENYCSKLSKRVNGSTTVFHKRLETPSAASLVSTGTGRSKESVPISCVFCTKNHKSQDCFVAQKMSLDERRKVLNEKGACYCCLRLGHNIKDCRTNIKCVLCKKKPFLLMCTKFQLTPSDKNEKRIIGNTSSDSDCLGKQSNVLANKATESGSTSEVFMQTLLVNVVIRKIDWSNQQGFCLTRGLSNPTWK